MLVNESKMRRYVARNVACLAGLLELLMSWTPLRVVFHESRWAVPPRLVRRRCPEDVPLRSQSSFLDNSNFRVGSA